MSHRHLAQRESPEGLINAALGEILLRGNEPSTANEADETGISFSMSDRGGGGVSRVGQIRHLVVRAELPGVGELRVWSDTDAERPRFDRQKWMGDNVTTALGQTPDPDAAMSFLTTMGEHLQTNREVFNERSGDLGSGSNGGPLSSDPTSERCAATVLGVTNAFASPNLSR